MEFGRDILGEFCQNWSRNQMISRSDLSLLKGYLESDRCINGQFPPSPK